MLYIKQLLQNGKSIHEEITLKGWVRTFRSNRFIALNDGSTIDNLQVVVDFENTNPDILKRITTGAAIEVKGKLVESQGKGQSSLKNTHWNSCAKMLTCVCALILLVP